MHDGELRLEAFVLQIRVEGLELQRRDHALVAEGAGAERDEVGVVLASRALTQAVHTAVELDAREGRRVADGGTGDEQLLEGGARRVRELSQVLLDRRHLTPAEHGETLGGGDLLDARLHGGAGVVVARQERHARGVLAGRGQVEVRDRAQEGIRHLRQDAGAVARSRVGADGTPVLEVPQRLECELHDVVPRLAAEGRDHREAAGVLLERRVVHALLGGEVRGKPGGVRRGVFTTGARGHVYRPHCLAETGTTSALMSCGVLPGDDCACGGVRGGFGRRGCADVDECIGVL